MASHEVFNGETIPPGKGGVQIIITDSLTPVFSTLWVCMRFYARRMRWIPIQVEDYMVLAALFLFYGEIICSFLSMVSLTTCFSFLRTLADKRVPQWSSMAGLVIIPCNCKPFISKNCSRFVRASLKTLPDELEVADKDVRSPVVLRLAGSVRHLPLPGQVQHLRHAATHLFRTRIQNCRLGDHGLLRCMGDHGDTDRTADLSTYQDELGPCHSRWLLWESKCGLRRRGHCRLDHRFHHSTPSPSDGVEPSSSDGEQSWTVFNFRRRDSVSPVPL